MISIDKLAPNPNQMSDFKFVKVAAQNAKHKHEQSGLIRFENVQAFRKTST